MKQKKLRPWSRLDNAAKIFPPASTKDSTNVFRFSCELYEEVDSHTLQQALDLTVEQFPAYLSVLKRGMFWYYLEASGLSPIVTADSKPPCSPIYDRNRRTLLFSVTYFRRRINLEVYHVLADGTGALQFMRTLVYHYLCIRHQKELAGELPLMDYDASAAQKMDDSFKKYYTGKQTSNGKKQREKRCAAYRLKGMRTAERRIKVIEGIMNTRELVDRAHEYHTTLTVFLTAVLLRAIFEEMPLRARRRPAVIKVPVDLRNYFPSVSARNFFSIINVGYDFSVQSHELEDIIQGVAASFKEELTEENLSRRLNALMAIEQNMFARIAPLTVKDVCMRAAYRFDASGVTATLSNVGRITMPAALEPYIRLFDICVSTNKLQICMCSFQDNVAVSFTSQFISSDIQRRFFRTLTQMGIEVELVTNQMDSE